jgi:hypothetical protein
LVKFIVWKVVGARVTSLLLAIWLIITGLAHFVSELRPLHPILPIVAIAAGVLIAISR